MRRRTGKRLLLAIFAAGIGLGAAPQAQEGEGRPLPPNAAKAAASFHAVAKAIDDATRPWDQEGAVTPATAPGWRTFFGALKSELATYVAATGTKAQLTSLGRLYQMESSLWGVSWAPAVEVRSALDEWLNPRVRIAWAERRLVDFVEAHRTDSPGSTEHAQQWKKFVDDDLGNALTAYEAAKTVQARRAALKRLTGVLASLKKNNQTVAWPYSAELQAALDNLYNLPNLDVSADLASVTPFLANDVVVAGPIYRDGYVSQVTPGPRTGFGLLASDEGIAFWNSQLGNSATPVTDFQQQLQQDQRGRKIAKLYYFTAESFDQPNVTVTAVIRPSTGLSLSSDYTHTVSAAFGALPIEGKGLARGVLSIIGLNRQKLLDKVGQQALPKMADGVVKGALEESAERIPVAEAEQNAKLRKVLVGNNTAAIRDFRITDLSLRSRPENALVSGKVGHAILPDAVGADMPQPPSLSVPASGVSADVHLGSALSNVVGGLLSSDEVRGVENVMIVTKAVQAGAPAKDGITIGKNVNFATFLTNIEAAKAANNPNVTAIRIKKPTTNPEFATDERGYLVALVRDFQMEVPAPPGGLLGGNAKVLRFLVPSAEFILSYKVIANGANPPTELDVKVEDFVHSYNSKVQTIADDDTKPTTMGPLPANLALGAFRTKLQQVPIKLPLSSLKIPGFDLTNISKLDPSGWMRVVLTPNGQPVKLPAVPTPATAEATPPSANPTAAIAPSVAR
jgi:hypothetical protein